MLRDSATGRVVWWGVQHMAQVTNNEAEYKGLELGLRAAGTLGAHHVDVRGDSDLILGQIAGSKQVLKKALISCHEMCRTLLSRIASSTLTHVFREANTCSDRLANLAADGWTKERWADGRPELTDRDEVCGSNRADVPDVATALLGIPPHLKEARVRKPVDWFQILRLSVLRHLYDVRNAALRNDHCDGARDIRRRVTRDFVRLVQLRLAADRECGALRINYILPDGVDRKNASVSDFHDIEAW